MNYSSEFINLLSHHNGDPYVSKSFESLNRVELLERKIRWKIASSYNEFNGVQSNFDCEEWNLINSEMNLNSKKIAVYTTILGNYDYLKPLFLEHKNIDFFVFTDKEIHTNICNITFINVNSIFDDNKSDTYINRFLKMHPYIFFSDYDYSLYIDSNVWVIGNINKLVSFVKKSEEKIGLYMHRHSNRNCIYKEARVLKIVKKGNKKKIKKQISAYKKLGFPREYGLLEATVILFETKSEIGKQILINWWNDFISKGSFRDQLSLPFVLWELGIYIQQVQVLGKNVKKSPFFIIEDHSSFF